MRRLQATGLTIVLLSGMLTAQIINVPADQPTIQAAIDIATPGTTIRVAPGTYVEALLIDPAGVHGPPRGQTMMTIEGTGPGVILQFPPQATRDAAWPDGITTNSGRQGDAILWAVGTTALVLRDLVFDGNDDMYTGNPPGPATTASSCGVSFRDGSGTVQQCNFMRIRQNATSGAQNGIGLLAEGITSVVAVDDCNFQTIQKSFVVISADATGNVSGCTFTGRGPVTSIAQNGVQFSGGGKGTVDQCVIDGFWFTPGSFTSAGVLAFDGGSPITISNCILRDCQTGIFWQANTVTTIDFTVVGCDLTDVAQAASGFDGIDIFDNTGGSLVGSWLIQNNTLNNLNGSGLWTNHVGAPGVVTGNYFNNNGEVFSFNNAEDGSAGGNNWDGNTWSDYASNGGFPGTYLVPGSAGAVDNMPSGDCPDFTSSQVTVGTAPLDVALCDTNGDSSPDIATADSGSDSVTILENDGSGGFGAAPITVALSSGDAPVAIASGDLGGSSDDDLAVACPDNDVVRILLNTGGGTYSISGLGAPVGSTRPADVVIADLDGAGTHDLAVALEGDVFGGGGGLAVGLNGGALALLAAPPAGFQRPARILACDLDGDGDEDLAATIRGTLGSSTTDNVLLYENDGAGNFTFAGTLTAGEDPNGLCCRDLDGDGDADLAVGVDAYPTVAFGGIVLFLNDGLVPGAWSIPADFTATSVFAGGILPRDVACADLGDDSIPGFFSRQDVVAANFGSGNISRFKGFDGADFGAIHSCALGQNPTGVVIGELNGDSTPDVVGVNVSTDSVTIARAIPRALAQKFGAGCPGTGGLVPDISPVGLPTHGNPAFGVQLTNGRPFSPVLLGVSLGLLPQDLGTGCTLYLAPEIITFQLFSDASGEATFLLPIPPDVAPFSGLNSYWQFVVFDPAGAHFGFLAFSDALRVKFGN